MRIGRRHVVDAGIDEGEGARNGEQDTAASDAMTVRMTAASEPAPDAEHEVQSAGAVARLPRKLAVWPNFPA